MPKKGLILLLYAAACTLVFGVVVLVFYPTLGFEFVMWDDDVNFAGNFDYRGLSLAHLRWMFTTFHMGPYQPLSWVTLGWDYLCWGMKSRGYHLSNVLFHAAAAAAFVWLILELLAARRRVTGWTERLIRLTAACVGAWFFALHPLRAESVAWITERRDVLSGFFYVLTVTAYVHACCVPGKRLQWIWHAGALGFFLLALLSKASGVTLPVVLLILDLYPLDRIKAGASNWWCGLSWRILEKTPWWAMALVFGLVAIHGQKTQASLKSVADYGLGQRLMQSIYGCCFYAWKTIWPLKLSPLYLMEEPFDPWRRHILELAIFLSVVSLLLLVLRRRQPACCVTWFAYLVLIAPLSGLLQAGHQVTADRYSYLACMPFAVLFGALLLRPARPGGRGWWLLLTVMIGVLILLSWRTRDQIGIWRNTRVLWDHAIALDRNHYLAYNNRGNDREIKGDIQGALNDYNKAIEVKPDYASSYNNRGKLFMEAGRLDLALFDFNRALELNPKLGRVWCNRGNLKFNQGDIEGALSDYASAIAANPNFFQVYANRALIRMRQGRLQEALDDYTRVLAINSEDPGALLNRSYLLLELGRLEEAIACCDRMLQLNPREPLAYLNRGVGLRHLGRFAEAETDLLKALQNAPQNWPYHKKTSAHLTAVRAGLLQRQTIKP